MPIPVPHAASRHAATLGLGLALLLATVPFGGCAGSAKARSDLEANAVTLLQDLAADEMGGRAPGTPGHARAKALILSRIEALDLRAPDGTPDGDHEQDFRFGPPGVAEEARTGTNLMGWIAGDTPGSGPALVVTAHYDHLGQTEDGRIYNGADDNASGVAAVLAIAEHLRRTPPRHDVWIVALDAEETSLSGAAAFLERPPLPRERIALNINLDMVSRPEGKGLWAAGANHTPALAPLVEAVARETALPLRLGFDGADPDQQDWTLMSDHGMFHRAGIPFLYLGVQDHPDYHQPSDTFDRIDPAEFLACLDAAIRIVDAADADLARLAAETTHAR